MEIGSFLELQMPNGCEYYSQTMDIARLNTGRNALWHAFRVIGAKAIWIPIYQCDTVRDTFISKNVVVKYYHIDSNFNPIDIRQEKGDAVLFVNYYGIMSHQRLSNLTAQYENVIIDNCQGFFTSPVEGAQNVYSCRKFVGVPDGSYVIGKNAHKFVEDYPQGYSSDTARFLLTRIEYGCEGKGYEDRSLNEHRVDSEDIKKMSKLTYTILDGTDYRNIIERRKKNFELAHNLLGSINCINPKLHYSDDCVPMVYPLVVENEELLTKLQQAKHFQGHWWSYICEEQPDDTFEHWLSRYVIPITIDQRYGCEEINYLASIILNNK